MSEGVDKVSAVLEQAVALVNAEQKLVVTDWKAVYKQVLDLDETEAVQLATKFQILELNNKDFEALLEGYVSGGAHYAAVVLRILRLFLPKPV